MPYKKMNLQLFAEDGVVSDTSADASVAVNVSTDGVATESGTEETATLEGESVPAEETWEELIKGKYKEDYNKAVKSAVQKRFKNQQDLQSKIDGIDPIVRAVAAKYGIQAAQDGSIPIQALRDALNNDNSIYEKEAFERGIPVDEVKRYKMLEQENNQLRMANARTEEQRQWDAIVEEGEKLKGTYPNFDLDAEMQNENFGRLFATMQRSGFPDALRTTYEMVHKDEIMSGAMQYAVQQTEQKLANAIQSGSRRPTENGTSQQAAAQTGAIDPSKLTLAQIEDINRRAQRGERITF